MNSKNCLIKVRSKLHFPYPGIAKNKQRYSVQNSFFIRESVHIPIKNIYLMVFLLTGLNFFLFLGIV